MKLAIFGTVGVRGTKLLLGVITAIVSARALGPAGRGEYYLVLTLAAFVIQFGNLGLHASNTYFVARDRSLLPALAGNSVWLAVVLGVSFALVAAPVVAMTGLLSGVQLSELLFVIALAPAGLYVLLGMNLLIGIRRVSLFNTLDIASSSLALVFVVIAAALLPNTTAFLASASAAAIVSAALVFRSVSALAGPIRFNLSLLRSGLRFAGKAYAISLLALLVLRLNVLTLNRYAGSGEVGNFSIALQFLDVLTIIPSATALVLFPTLVRDETTAWTRAVRNTAIVGTVMTVLCVPTAVFAPALVSTVFGPEFKAAAEMLLLLLPGAVLLGMATVLSQFLAAVGLPISLVIAWSVAATTAGALGLLFIPAGAGRGAASVLSITYAGLFFIVFVLAFIHRGDRGAQVSQP